MLLGFLHCLILPHKPDKRRVKKTTDGSYHGHCVWCGKRIRRKRRDKWVRARRQRDNLPD